MRSTELPAVLISVAELQAARKRSRLRIVDVRWSLGDPDGPQHFLAGHIPGAVYVDLETELSAVPTPSRGRHPLPTMSRLTSCARSWGLCAGDQVVVYDATGGLAAARAWWLLRWAGMTQVRILDGGLPAWAASGAPLSSGAGPAPVPGDITLSSGHLPVITADGAARWSGTLLDARAPERYRGDDEPIDPRAGHIPGAINAPTTDNLGPTGHFHPAAKLRDRFAQLGDGPFAVYCGSGITATHQIAALASAGHQAALYPGSWSQWAHDRKRPVALGEEPTPLATNLTPPPASQLVLNR